MNVIPLDQARLDSLRKSFLFSCLSDELFAETISDSSLVPFKLGTLIASAEQSRQSLFVLLSGKLRVLAHDKMSGEERSLVALSKPGDVYGYFILEPETLLLSAQGASEGTALHLDSKILEKLVELSEPFKERLKSGCRSIVAYGQLSRHDSLAKFSYWQLRPLLIKSTIHVHQTDVEPLNMVVSDPTSIIAGLEGCIQRETNGRLELLEPGKVCRVASFLDEGDWQIRSGAKLWIISGAIFLDLQSTHPDLWAELLHTPGWRNVIDSDGAISVRPVSVKIAEPETNQRIALDETGTVKARRFLRRYPFIRQQTQMDCGATCLAMISQFYGKSVSLNNLRQLCNVSSYGTTLLSIAEAAEKLGFTTRGVRCSFDGLKKLRMPIICHWKGNHFVVLYGIEKERAIVGDPAEDILHLGREPFLKGFSGVALELTPTQEFGRLKAGTPVLLSYLPIAKPFFPLIRDVFVASFAYQILMLVSPLFTQQVVDKVIVHQSLSMLNVMLVGIGIVTIFSVIINGLRGFMLAYLAMSIDQVMFSQFYRHLLRLPLAFLEQRTTGEIIARFGENKKITTFLSGAAVTIVLDLLTFIVYLAIIFSYNLKYAAAASVSLALTTILVIAYTPVLKRIARRVYDKDVASTAFLIESVRGFERIKSAAAENRTRWRWELLFIEAMHARFKSMVASNMATVISQAINTTAGIGLLWLGANLVIEGELTIGQLVALNVMVGMLSQPLMKLVELWNNFQDVNISLERLGDVLEAQPEEPEPEKKLVLTNLQGQIQFENVTFRYSSVADKNTLVNVSFNAMPGQMVALVGRSGSGKSTVVKLIQGLYLPVEGRIFIDGQDIRQLSLRDLRRQTGVVAQQEYLFRGTVRDAIAFHKEEASLEEIIAAAKLAGIHDFVQSLPYGYETLLSEGASNVSGGQKQRLAIATALLHKPNVLIFDEATSALDSESEKKIQEGLEAIRHGRTMFVVAHRLSTVRTADLILVMDRGQIVERGTHSSLIAERGLYYYLCTQQNLL